MNQNTAGFGARAMCVVSLVNPEQGGGRSASVTVGAGSRKEHG